MSGKQPGKDKTQIDENNKISRPGKLEKVSKTGKTKGMGACGKEPSKKKPSPIVWIANKDNRFINDIPKFKGVQMYNLLESNKN